MVMFVDVVGWNDKDLGSERSGHFIKFRARTSGQAFLVILFPNNLWRLLEPINEIFRYFSIPQLYM